MPGKATNWNHDYRFKISPEDVKIIDAEYEGEVVEAVIAVKKTAKAELTGFTMNSVFC